MPTGSPRSSHGLYEKLHDIDWADSVEVIATPVS